LRRKFQRWKEANVIHGDKCFTTIKSRTKNMFYCITYASVATESNIHGNCSNFASVL